MIKDDIYVLIEKDGSTISGWSILGYTMDKRYADSQFYRGTQEEPRRYERVHHITKKKQKNLKRHLQL